MTNCEIIKECLEKGRIEITNPYLRVYFEDMVYYYDLVGSRAKAQEPISFTEYMKYNGLRKAYSMISANTNFMMISSSIKKSPDELAKIYTKEYPSFNQYGLITLEEFKKFDDLMIDFTKKMSAKYNDYIPQDEKTKLPFGVRIEVRPGEIREYLKKYVVGNISNNETREIYENSVIPSFTEIFKMDKSKVPSWEEIVKFQELILDKVVSIYEKDIRTLNESEKCSLSNAQNNYDDI